MGHGIFVRKPTGVNCHHSQTNMGPYTYTPTPRVPPTAFDSPHTHLIHLGLGLLQSPVTGEVWRGCRGTTLPSRGSRGGRGSGSRPEEQGRIKTQGLQPPGPAARAPPIHLSILVPPVLLFGRKATRCKPWSRSSPAADELRDLERGPPSPRPQFPRLSTEGDLTDAIRVDPKRQAAAVTGAGRGRRTLGPLLPAAIARAGQPRTRGSSAARAQSPAWAWPRGAGNAGETPGTPHGWLPRAAAGAGKRGEGGGRPTHMAGAAGGGLGSGSDGGGGSRWLRLALAARDGKMAAARHPHPGTAGGGGAPRETRRERGRGGGALRGGGRAGQDHGPRATMPRQLPRHSRDPKVGCCGFPKPTATPPCLTTAAPKPPATCPLEHNAAWPYT